MPADQFASALADAGGVHAPREHHARLGTLLAAVLGRDEEELGLARSGQAEALAVTIAARDDGLVAVVRSTPACAPTRRRVPERGWHLTAAVVGALVEASGTATGLRAGRFGDHLAVWLPGRAGDEDAELAAIAFGDAHAVRISRLRTRALAGPSGCTAWGNGAGYHTNFAHLARGLAGNDRALAEALGEALLDAGLLQEKQSVGQRHVNLNPRAPGAIHEAIETGRLPAGLTLPTPGA